IGGDEPRRNGDGALGRVGKAEGDARRQDVVDLNAGGDTWAAVRHGDRVGEIAADDNRVRAGREGDTQVSRRADGSGNGGGVIVRERINLIGGSGGGGGDNTFEDGDDANGGSRARAASQRAEGADDDVPQGGGRALRDRDVLNADVGREG